MSGDLDRVRLSKWELDNLQVCVGGGGGQGEEGMGQSGTWTNLGTAHCFCCYCLRYCRHHCLCYSLCRCM